MTKQAYLAEKEIEFDTPPLKIINMMITFLPQAYTKCIHVVDLLLIHCKFKGLKDIKFYSKAEKYFSQDIK